MHSPVHRGFAYSHVGWIFAPHDASADLQKVPDLARHPELVWLYKFESAPAVTMGALCFHPLMGGMDPDLGWESLELYASKVLPRIS